MISGYGGKIPDTSAADFIAPGSVIIGDVKLGRNSGVWYNAVLRGDMGPIIIGDDTNIQDGCLLHCIKDVPVKVGKGVTVGHGAILHSCVIGDGTMIGMGAVVLDGARIGSGCIIGAGSLIPPGKDIPDNSMAFGSPAKVIRTLEPDELEQIRANAQEYIMLAQQHSAMQSSL